MSHAQIHQLLLFFKKKKFRLYLFVNKTQQQIRFMTESDHIAKLRTGILVLPVCTGTTMNLVISYAFKAKKTPHVYGLQVSGFIKFRAELWQRHQYLMACVIHVLYTWSLELSCLFCQNMAFIHIHLLRKWLCQYISDGKKLGLCAISAREKY